MKKCILSVLLIVTVSGYATAQSASKASSKKPVKKSASSKNLSKAQTITHKDTTQYPAKLPLLPPITDTAQLQKERE